MISLGPSRADRQLAHFSDLKMDREAGPVLRAYLDEVLRTNSGDEVEAVRRALDAGVVTAMSPVEGPRAEG